MEPIRDWLDEAMPTVPREVPEVGFELGPDGIPYFPGMGDAFFNAEGDMHTLPAAKPPRPLEQAIKLNMMTAEARGASPFPPGGHAPDIQKACDAEVAQLEATLAPVQEGMPKAGEDMVNLPAHYARFKIEPIRFIGENKLDWFQGNIVKYALRWDAKNGIQDIDKVIRYAQMMKQFYLGNPDWWQAGKPEDFKS